MTSPSEQLQFQREHLKQDGYVVNSEQQTIESNQWKQQEHVDFYTKQNVASVLSPLSSNASSSPTDSYLQATDMTQPPSLLVSSSSTPSPKVIQVNKNESIPSPPPSSIVKGMDIQPPRKKKSPSPSTLQPTTMTRDQIKYCSALIRNLKRHRDATPFLHPVDYIKLNVPDYPQVIKTPMDLTTIDRKLQHKEYVDVSQFINDIRLLFNNCYKFNGPEAVVSMLCQNLESAFEKSLRQMPLSTKTCDPSSSTPQDNKNQSLEAISPIFRRRRDTNRPTPPPTASPYPSRRYSSDNSSHPTKRRKTDAQLKFCVQVIRELKKTKHRAINYPFLYPVDAVALNIPDYHTIITHPMDISTIERHLTNGDYSSADDVESDIRLMFNNCYRYNPPTLPVHKMAKQLEMVFNEKWKQLPKLDSTPSTPLPSRSTRKPSLAFHDDSSDDSTVSDGDDRIAELERRIAGITQQIQSIKSTKRKPASSKHDLSRKARRTSSATTSSKPRRRAPSPPKRPSSTTDLPEFTFDQKKELSESINNLTGDGLSTVVNIIQNSMPNLDGEGQDEIVLDIDVLDRKTLHQLYEFATGKSLLQKQRHQPKKRKSTDKNQRLRALEASLQQISARAVASSDSGDSSESEDDSGSD